MDVGVYRAAMDIGTNSCRLIIVELIEGGDFTHERQIRITRIGEGLGRGGLHIGRAAMDRTLAALAEYKTMIAAYPVERVRLLGTQALREADNGREFAAEVKRETGFELEIISGRREAYLSYTGAISGFTDPTLIRPLVLDIGGGSTELILEDVPESKTGRYGDEIRVGSELRGGSGSRSIGERPVCGVSAPVGCLRLLEKPLGDQEILAALKEGWDDIAIRGSEAEEYEKSPLVTVGGTATTMGAIHLKMKDYDPDALLGLRMSRRQVEAEMILLESLSPRERLTLPGMMPGREDVMPWGLRILLAAMTYCRRDAVMICDRDLLYGALFE